MARGEGTKQSLSLWPDKQPCQHAHVHVTPHRGTLHAHCPARSAHRVQLGLGNVVRFVRHGGQQLQAAGLDQALVLVAEGVKKVRQFKMPGYMAAAPSQQR